MSEFLNVTYDVHGSAWFINSELAKLVNVPLMSFDIETKGMYDKEERKEALKFLEEDDHSMYHHKLASVVANNSGLSFPSVTSTTHFIFGLSRTHSVILVTRTPREEMLVWNWLRNYRGKLLIHNTLFDLKVMYHRVGDLPHDYEDTALLAKTLINNADSWRAKVGLKDLMGDYYHPWWSMYDEYEPANLKDKKFLEYAAIDGAATFYLWELLQEYL